VENAYVPSGGANQSSAASGTALAQHQVAPESGGVAAGK
jgi:hypothetical protein